MFISLCSASFLYVHVVEFKVRKETLQNHTLHKHHSVHYTETIKRTESLLHFKLLT